MEPRIVVGIVIFGTACVLGFWLGVWMGGTP